MQPRYRERISARASSLNLISVHQQPRKLAPHEKSLPHASQVGPRRSGIKLASFRNISVGLTHLLCTLCIAAFQSYSPNPFLVRDQHFDFDAPK